MPAAMPIVHAPGARRDPVCTFPPAPLIFTQNGLRVAPSFGRQGSVQDRDYRPRCELSARDIEMRRASLRTIVNIAARRQRRCDKFALPRVKDCRGGTAKTSATCGNFLFDARRGKTV